MSKTKTVKRGERATRETREDALARLLEVALALADNDYDLSDNTLPSPTRADLCAAGLATTTTPTDDLPTSWDAAFQGECLYWLACAKRKSVAPAATRPSARIGADLVNDGERLK